MGLAEVQRLLARLATDATLRARFRQDPAGVGREFGLTPAEASRQSGLPIEEVDQFARSLIGKRRGAVESLLPLTRRALGPERFASGFGRHARDYQPAGIKKHRDDAVAFASFLTSDPTDPPWLADLIRLEAASLLAHDPAHRWSMLRLRHHPSDLARSAVEGGSAPRRRVTLIVWFRVSKRSRLRRVLLAWPW